MFHIPDFGKKGNQPNSSSSSSAFVHVYRDDETSGRSGNKNASSSSSARVSNNNNNNNNNNSDNNFQNHISMTSHDDRDMQKIVTGRRRPPQHQLAQSGHAENPSALSVPWAETAALGPIKSTTQETFQSGVDRDRNYRKALRKEFKKFDLQHLIPGTLAVGEKEIEEEEQEEEREGNYENEHNNNNNNNSSSQHNNSSRKKHQKPALSNAALVASQKMKQQTAGRGVRDLKMTTIPNDKKRFHPAHVDRNKEPGHSGHNPQFAPTIDEIGQSDPANRRSSTTLTNGASRTKITPYLVYQDEVAHLPAIPQVGITYTGEQKEDKHEIVFPWDRPRVDRNGAARLARREARRLVTQRRLEFAEQFLPEVCAGITTEMSNRVADQYNTNHRLEGQPVPTAVEALEFASLRTNAHSQRTNKQQQLQQKKKQQEQQQQGILKKSSITSGSSAHDAILESGREKNNNNNTRSEQQQQQQQQQQKPAEEKQNEKRHYQHHRHQHQHHQEAEEESSNNNNNAFPFYSHPAPLHHYTGNIGSSSISSSGKVILQPSALQKHVQYEESKYDAEHGRRRRRDKRNEKVEIIKKKVQNIVHDHDESLKRHDLIMQVAVASV